MNWLGALYGTRRLPFLYVDSAQMPMKFVCFLNTTIKEMMDPFPFQIIPCVPEIIYGLMKTPLPFSLLFFPRLCTPWTRETSGFVQDLDEDRLCCGQYERLKTDRCPPANQIPGRASLKSISES